MYVKGLFKPLKLNSHHLSAHQLLKYSINTTDRSLVSNWKFFQVMISHAVIILPHRKQAAPLLSGVCWPVMTACTLSLVHWWHCSTAPYHWNWSQWSTSYRDPAGALPVRRGERRLAAGTLSQSQAPATGGGALAATQSQVASCTEQNWQPWDGYTCMLTGNTAKIGTKI